MAPRITLYRANRACSLAPHILLHELNIPFVAVLMVFGPNGVESADGSISQKDYLKIHPVGQVPALQVDDEIITENPAILTYIASLAPDNQLFGRNAVEKAKVYQWLCWLSGTLHGYGYGMILAPKRFTHDPVARPGVVEQGRKTIRDCYEKIESSLHGDHVVGDCFTVADINTYIFWGWGQLHGFEMAEHYPRYGRLAKAVEQNEGVRAALKAERLPLQFAGEDA